MSYSSILGSRGRLTLPLEVRRKLGLSAGDRVEFVCEEGYVILRRLMPSPNPFDKYTGVLDTFPGGTKQINAWLRRLRGR